MNSLSSITFSNPHFSLESSRPKDHTLAEQYPVFITTEKLSKLISSSFTPISHPFRTSSTHKPAPLSTVSESKSSISNKQEFKVSKFPSSSLNIELERQCILSELYQNIHKLKTKPKFFPPIKVVWNKGKAQSKESIETSGLNMKAVINGDHKNPECAYCNETRCRCRVVDEFCERTWHNIKHRYKERSDIFERVKRSKLSGRVSEKVNNSYSNWIADKIEMRRTRRRRVMRSDTQGLNGDVLSVSPKQLYIKILDQSAD